MNASRHFGAKSAGFTLIELLVVIAIIALLVTILVPALQQARELASRAVCSANMRNAVTALATYHVDYETYPVHTYKFPWASAAWLQYDIDGYRGDPARTSWSGVPGQWYSGSYKMTANSAHLLFKLLIDGEYSAGGRDLACSSRYGRKRRAGTTSQSGWEYSAEVPSPPGFYDLPDGESSKYVPFFAYNGPGVDGHWMRSYYDNPLAAHDGETVTCVRPTHGYVNGDASRKVKGLFKLLSCPTNIQILPGPQKLIFTPHGQWRQLGLADAGWGVEHFRNFAWVDGHVEGKRVAGGTDQ